MWFYTAGSSTPENTYTTYLGTVANANPVILDSGGYPATGGSVVEIWFTSGVSYKAVLATSADVIVWTRDRLVGINDTTVTIDQWVSGAAPTYISATSFSLVGDQTSTYQVGRRLKTTNTGGTIYSTIIASAFGAVTTITVINDSGVLDSGLSAVSYGLLSATNRSIPTTDSPFGICELRLSLTTAVPVTTSDVTAAEALYWVPYIGNRIALFDGTATWTVLTTVEISIDIPDATNCYDVFVYANAGVPTLELTAWTNATTRATALVRQNGVLVKTGATTRRYLGTFYSTTAGNGQVEDSFAKRNLWNYYHRVLRPMKGATETANTWTYTLGTYQQANANAANQLEYTQGVLEDTVIARVTAGFQNSSLISASVGVGLDSTSANSAQLMSTAQNQVVNIDFPVMAQYKGFPGVGRHLLVWLEVSQATGLTTWVGDNGATLVQSGITGELMG